jgi:chromosome segregation protein
VHIKRLELSNFKSFGGTTQIPLLPNFTVVSGPNGSGKSNILDALLFALGLSSSKGMRAERLPDLVNHQSSKSRSTVEASVTVAFELGDQTNDRLGDQVEERSAAGEPEVSSEKRDQNGHPGNNGHRESGQSLPSTEWSVTRKLRVTPQGTYTSTYAINGEPCTLNDLHEQLQHLRIYPEGYNVVLQGDVTGIISMPPRERRQIIDELAGVANFDRKITQAKEKLDLVKECEDSCRIVEGELIEQRNRLAQECVQAQKYQKLRAEFQGKSQWEAVLLYQQQVNLAEQLRSQLAADAQQEQQLTGQAAELDTQIQQATTDLDQLNQRVHALGEEEYLALQATLATHDAELRQLQRQQEKLSTTRQETAEAQSRTQGDLGEYQHTLVRLQEEQQTLETTDLVSACASRDAAQQTLEASRVAASTIATQAQAWIQQQSALHQQITTLQQTIEPQRTEQAQLGERLHQLQRQIQEQTPQLAAIDAAVLQTQVQVTEVLNAQPALAEQVVALAQAVSAAEDTLQVHQQTQTRLLQEQRDKQRQLDKLEAKAQAIQESQGTHATQLILKADLPGVHGLIAQLGRVEPQLQLALEIAAGARLGHLVVDDDTVAAAGIELLKQKRAGRATFLPLNKIQAPKPLSLPAWQRPEGMIDLAVNLIDCDNRYQAVFAYVFGNTVVFDALNQARRYLGQFRMVTLEGELLESSGAMTGGSTGSSATALHFGSVAASEAPQEIRELQLRLRELEDILERCGWTLQQASADIQQRSQQLIEARQQHRDSQRHAEQLQAELQRLTSQQQHLQTQLTQNTQECEATQAHQQGLTQRLPILESQLAQVQQALAELEQSQRHSEWQQTQEEIRVQEAQLNGWELIVRNTEQRLRDLLAQQQVMQEKIQQAQQRITDYGVQQAQQATQHSTLTAQHSALSTQIAHTQAAIAQLEHTLGETKQQRDHAEQHLRALQTTQQQVHWHLQKLQETQQACQSQLSQLQTQLATQRAELPDPLPELPTTLTLESLQQELRSLQKRIQAMEPVNMLALEEHERTQARLQELSEKLATLESERTELLLRIENFTTLRQRAFQEAFDAVNTNFQSIFAVLSEGDGYLELDDPQDPFNSGLNLIAHPKGKPVQRLASMSGGEKSLTALSFIFALQRYRPSPFYAFDEVDMFLDGANVERLAKMIKQQAQNAQFIVVSLRRPMIESAERTIGVTQARGAYTQVLGLKLQPQSASG